MERYQCVLWREKPYKPVMFVELTVEDTEVEIVKRKLLEIILKCPKKIPVRISKKILDHIKSLKDLLNICDNKQYPATAYYDNYYIYRREMISILRQISE